MKDVETKYHRQFCILKRKKLRREKQQQQGMEKQEKKSKQKKRFEEAISIYRVIEP